MTHHYCSCGFAAEDADALQDHLLDVFALEVDRGNDGRIHAEVITPAESGQPRHVCTCGFASEIIADFDGSTLSSTSLRPKPPVWPESRQARAGRPETAHHARERPARVT